MAYQQYVVLGVISLVFGYIVLRGLIYLLPRKLRSQNELQKKLRLQEAQRKAELFRVEELARTEENITTLTEDLDGAIQDRLRDLKEAEEELVGVEQDAKNKENRYEKMLRELESHQVKVNKVTALHQQMLNDLQQQKNELQGKLAKICDQETEKLQQNLIDAQINERQLEVTKYLKIYADELNISASKAAQRALDSVHARYTPVFIWPKGVNHVEVKDAKIVELLSVENPPLLTELIELTEGVNISLSAEANRTSVVRLAGGYGIYKEAAKLTLEELVNRGPTAWSKCKPVYEKHRQHLESIALKLGKRAIFELRLKDMHIEILKMIGALNWRTSYRQNQYYHSLEVAKLAGILAIELGVDPEAAKRSGLLHDIGKGIDYRIEGSHAVISGDYADRFGERKVICDTVMSHHSDLLVETPLAYVLRAADTLSGARPGARVNIEEGYQDRLSSIVDVVQAFPGVIKVEIMNGAREVHVEVNHRKVQEDDLKSLSAAIARKIEENVAYPGQIKIMVTRRFEAVAVA